jgi:hypothetical protein
MAVYVDNQKNKYGRMLMCHMVADSIDELHEFAVKIGLKREWFQGENEKNPHYDLSQAKRKKAVDNGAIEIGSKELIEVLRAWRIMEGVE